MSELQNNKASKEKARTKSKFQEIQEMPVAEKIKLAMLGDKEARSILIKDGNKQVQEAVLASQRITELEIAGIANSRTVSEDLLRKIASNRQWLKNYQIRLALVQNPKTPLPVALKLLNTLLGGDLKRLSKSKAVPNVIAVTAGRMALKKGQS